MINVRRLRPVHPFPARMAASIPLARLTGARKSLTVVDPMSGSGTTLFVARALGHRAFGFDTDPLARMVASVWCGDLNEAKLRNAANKVFQSANRRWRQIAHRDSYPSTADRETKKFVRYWFDLTNRKQLAILSKLIGEIPDKSVQEQLWCAFSRLIIVKQKGVSLAMDVSHSRPHRVYSVAPIRPLDGFLSAVEYIIRAKNNQELRGSCRVRAGDARNLPMRANTCDLVITSPPYLNAIDYLRGHKLSLVWMGRTIEELRNLRSSNIGAERRLTEKSKYGHVLSECLDTHKVGLRFEAMFARYLSDMHAVLKETYRILRLGGEAIFVVGDSMVRGNFVRNSTAVCKLGVLCGFKLSIVSKRNIPSNRRYLPPPSIRSAGKSLQARMRKESIITFIKN